MRVANQPQVAEQVLDLRALVKAETAHHGVTDVVAPQRLLHQPRLRIGAIQHGAMSRSRVRTGVRVTEKFLDAIGDKKRLVFAVRRLDRKSTRLNSVT